MNPQPLTAEQLAEVERLAGLMFSAQEIGNILGLGIVLHDGTVLGYDPEQGDDKQPVRPFATAQLRGRLLQEAAVRSSVFDLAKSGSAPAQTLAVQIINQARVAAAGL